MPTLSLTREKNQEQRYLCAGNARRRSRRRRCPTAEALEAPRDVLGRRRATWVESASRLLLALAVHRSCCFAGDDVAEFPSSSASPGQCGRGGWPGAGRVGAAGRSGPAPLATRSTSIL